MNQELKNEAQQLIMGHKVCTLANIMNRREMSEDEARSMARAVNAGFDELEQKIIGSEAQKITLTREQIKLLAEFTSDEHPDSFVICYGTIPSHDDAEFPGYNGLIAYSENPDDSLVVALDNAKPEKQAERKLASED